MLFTQGKRLHDEKGDPLPGEGPAPTDKFKNCGGGGKGKKRAASGATEGEPPKKSAYHLAMGF